MAYFEELADAFIDLQKRIQPTLLIEVGAREGTFSNRVKNLLPNSEVHAFEANQKIYEDFRHDFVSKNIHYHNLGVSNKSLSADFYIEITKHQKDGSHSFKPRNNSDLKYIKQKVQTVTLDVFFQSALTAESKVCLWIVAEGCGAEVLEGASNVLEHTQSIFIEVEHKKFWKNQKLAKQVERSLGKKNFFLVGRDMEHFPVQENQLYINPWRAKFV